MLEKPTKPKSFEIDKTKKPKGDIKDKLKLAGSGLLGGVMTGAILLGGHDGLRGFSQRGLDKSLQDNKVAEALIDWPYNVGKIGGDLARTIIDSGKQSWDSGLRHPDLTDTQPQQKFDSDLKKDALRQSQLSKSISTGSTEDATVTENIDKYLGEKNRILRMFKERNINIANVLIFSPSEAQGETKRIESDPRYAGKRVMSFVILDTNKLENDKPVNIKLTYEQLEEGEKILSGLYPDNEIVQTRGQDGSVPSYVILEQSKSEPNNAPRE